MNYSSMNCPKDLVLLLKHKVHHRHFVSQCHNHGDLYHCRNNRKQNLFTDTEMLCIPCCYIQLKEIFVESLSHHETI